MSLSMGIDLGTSACRVAVIDESSQLVYLSRADLAKPTDDGLRCEQSPEDWWRACQIAIEAALKHVDRAQVTRIAVDGTSSTLLLCNKEGKPKTAALMYRDQRAQSQAEQLSHYAPHDTAVHSASSSLAKLLWFKDNGQLEDGLIALHQADWLMGRLRGKFDTSDENNALKLGYDVINRCWPSWLSRCQLPPDCLPKVVPAGQNLGKISAEMAQQFRLAPHCQIIAGTTDSTASFIASGAKNLGDAVTVLGSSLVIKILSDKPVFEPDMGVYSHRLGENWLVGGASNSGGAVLKQFFNNEQIERLSHDIDPKRLINLNYVPLPAQGERFPIKNKDLQPNFEPRPIKDVDFLQAILESIAKIEQQGYKTLANLGAPSPRSIRSCGGGAKNQAWQSIRQQRLNSLFLAPEHEEAAVGTALLAALNK